jgi:hypothetical protein
VLWKAQQAHATTRPRPNNVAPTPYQHKPDINRSSTDDRSFKKNPADALGNQLFATELLQETQKLSDSDLHKVALL